MHQRLLKIQAFIAIFALWILSQAAIVTLIHLQNLGQRAGFIDFEYLAVSTIQLMGHATSLLSICWIGATFILLSRDLKKMILSLMFLQSALIIMTGFWSYKIAKLILKKLPDIM